MKASDAELSCLNLWRSNKRMEPTGMSVFFIRELECLIQFFPAAHPRRWAASLLCAVIGLWRGGGDDFHS